MAGLFPPARSLGLEGTSLLLATTRMVGTAVASVSCTRGFDLLGDLAGLRISPRHVERGAADRSTKYPPRSRRPPRTEPHYFGSRALFFLVWPFIVRKAIGRSLRVNPGLAAAGVAQVLDDQEIT